LENDLAVVAYYILSDAGSVSGKARGLMISTHTILTMENYITIRLGQIGTLQDERAFMVDVKKLLDAYCDIISSVRSLPTLLTDPVLERVREHLSKADLDEWSCVQAHSKNFKRPHSIE
jgi:hypothetical protein